ncbi:MAG TPA: sulfotransferase [Sphingomicrobium sp.]|nr:sulfotransferase [Sphingomicrobium sp.]
MGTTLNSRTGQSVAEALAQGRRLLDGSPAVAAAQARAVLSAHPGNADAYRLLGQALRRAGDKEGASEAELAAISASVRDPQLLSAGRALVANDLPAAESILRPLLHRRPTDVAAIRMMAELAARVGRPSDAENLLRRAIELAPAWEPPRANLATVLYRQNRWQEALEELGRIETPEDDSRLSLKAAVLGRVGAYEEGIGLYREILKRHRGQPKIWMSLGHMLKTVGDQQGSVDAYRQAIALAPSLGEVWWSLANLKTVRFSDRDVAAMQAALADPGLGDDDRLHLHFALGKAFEDRGADENAFGHYAQGNAIRAGQVQHDPARVSRRVDRTIAVFTSELLAERAGHGCAAPDPIFVLGMPRAGSTLVEQILASHPEVEGTMELPDLIMIARRLSERGKYPALLADLPADELRALGQEYLDRTRVHRSSGRPFFIDKMPNNWLHVGLIRLILPNARIVDARRHPLACCFSNFKQHFARGQSFSYDLEHLGLYYADYVRLMAHFDRVAPGAVHRVIHERLVDDPEGEIRRLLAFLGLPFDEACLRFHETQRPVATASSQQVRRPITAEGVDQWRRFERWLGPLEKALGPALASWDDAAAQ